MKGQKLQNYKDYGYVLQSLLFLISIVAYSYTYQLAFLVIPILLFSIRMAIYVIAASTLLNYDLFPEVKNDRNNYYRNPALRFMLQLIHACSLYQIYQAGFIIFTGTVMFMMIIEFFENIVSWIMLKEVKK